MERPTLSKYILILSESVNRAPEAIPGFKECPLEDFVRLTNEANDCKAERATYILQRLRAVDRQNPDPGVRRYTVLNSPQAIRDQLSIKPFLKEALQEHLERSCCLQSKDTFQRELKSYWQTGSVAWRLESFDPIDSFYPRSYLPRSMQEFRAGVPCTTTFVITASSYFQAVVPSLQRTLKHLVRELLCKSCSSSATRSNNHSGHSRSPPLNLGDDIYHSLH